MDAEQIKEWFAFEQRALESVRSGSVPSEMGIKRVLQITIVPSFEPAICWEICQRVPSSDKNYFVVTTRWQRNDDVVKFETPVERLKHPRILDPTIETQSLDLVSFTVEEFLDRLKSVSIAAYVGETTCGFDGTQYELAFGDFFLNAKYSWWQEPPIEWKPLGEAVMDFLHKLEQLCK